jgi:tripartite-type tricarboxylate transporter receptor subunit TctC
MIETKRFIKHGAICLLAAFGAVCASAALAQNWPTAKPIAVLNPAPAGGVLDVLLRITSEFVAKRIGQSMVVESRSGGAGVIVGQAVATQPADGYIVGSMYTSHVINPHVMASMPYDSVRDFIPVSLLATPNLVLVATADAPYSNVPELIKYTKDNPDKVSFGVPGLGGAAHFGFESFRMAAGASIVVVPYRGEAPALADVLGGTVNLSLVTTGAAQPHISAGKLKVLAAFSEKRLSSYPNLPSVSEGLPGFKPLSA